ncbi:hypothetical protein QO200_09445 [Flavobacterium sp. Arc3]|jgi:hypothetical protein|uniref:hypothetical protein n=1 Tax=unclassified Flavobacterium TaxID=196869 RepID=UPI00352E7DFD
MKTLFLNFVLLIFCTQFLFSQDRDENSLVKNYSSSVFDKKEAALSVLSSSAKNENTKDAYLNNQNSGVSIQQIGDYNYALIDVKSKISNISLNQYGDNNQYSLVKEAKNIFVDVSQKGNNSKIEDYSFRTNYDVNTQMIQNGSNQNIKSIGTNSISKDMKVSQTGNGASVIILNKLN